MEVRGEEKMCFNLIYLWFKRGEREGNHFKQTYVSFIRGGIVIKKKIIVIMKPKKIRKLTRNKKNP